MNQPNQVIQLQRAETNLQAARDLVEKEYFDIAAARAYYSASALLLSQGIDTNKHSGVIALIHQRFVKTGNLVRNKERT
ncbi:MAG: HEPN domain-containing protein [Chloroflexi bacterium]|nr:HEPN domain-containing protein [Chloroflexota bacterium]MCA2001595.1 HEPN domain-containing protein [Chloroflexota bacterium]